MTNDYWNWDEIFSYVMMVLVFAGIGGCIYALKVESNREVQERLTLDKYFNDNCKVAVVENPKLVPPTRLDDKGQHRIGGTRTAYLCNDGVVYWR